MPASKVGWEAKGDVGQLVMGVLARYVGSRIRNDEDFPATPLPRFRKREGLRPQGRAGKRARLQIRWRDDGAETWPHARRSAGRRGDPLAQRKIGGASAPADLETAVNLLADVATSLAQPRTTGEPKSRRPARMALFGAAGLELKRTLLDLPANVA